MKRLAWLMLALMLTPLRGFVLAEQPLRTSAPAALRYLSPPDGGQFVPPGTTLALRLDGPINPQTLSPSLFSLVGSSSGPHAGQVQLAGDSTTVVFKPSTPFAPGERVLATVKAGLTTQAGAVFPGLHTEFNISAGGANLQAISADMAADELREAKAANTTTNAPAGPNAVTVQPQDFVTLPGDFPAYTVTVPPTNTAPGLLFQAPIRISGSGRDFLLITKDTGEPVFWQAAGFAAFDFKKQPNGSLTYFDQVDNHFHVLDNTYSETKTIGAANGYTTDIHDLQILPNGDALFLIYDPQITSTVQFGGYPTATVVGLVIQELDPSGLPVFQWESWSHFAISDTYVSLTTTVVDYVHGNAIERDYDGNLLLSSRHLSEITKIGRDGNILWRLGGKNNQFAITDPYGPFSCQHDIRRLASGNITIYDNHNPGPCSVGGTFSRAVEYQIDENAKVVTNTWQYRNTPDEFGPFTGNNQRLPDGHRLIDWGFAHPNATEVLTDGTKLFEMAFGPTVFSYRAFRFPWSAVPAWDPTLVLTGTITPTLYYSWNGATDVASYEIYGGYGPQPQTLVGTQPRTGFEDHTALVGVPPSFCSFRVRPIDHQGQPQRFSNVVYTSTPCYGFSDIGVTKFVNAGVRQPGQTLTYTLVFSNAGPDLVPSALLTDIVPANLVAITYTSSGAALTPVGLSPYAWQVVDLAPGAGGVVTVTGVLSGGLHGTVFTNTATITTDYSDTNPANNTSAVSVTVADVAPVAASDVYTVVQNAMLTVTAPGVLANDSDANGDVLTATLGAHPLTGAPPGLHADGSFTYTPPLGFTGPITFTYQAGDGQLLSTPTVVTITVRAYQLFLPLVRR